METNTIPSINVLCRANGQARMVLYRDEPLALNVTILNMDAVSRGPHNMALLNDRRDLEEKFKEGILSEEKYRRELKTIDEKIEKFLVLRFGSPEGWTHFISFSHHSAEKWIPLPWPLNRMAYDPPTEYALLDETNRCYIEFGLDPADGAQVEPAEYQVRAEVEILPGTIVVSDPVIVVMIGEPIPEKDRVSEDYFYTHGYYWQKRERYNEALEYAREGLSHFPDSIRLLMLLGDIEDGRKNLSAALRAYETALTELQKRTEERARPPDALLYRITRMRSRLNE